MQKTTNYQLCQWEKTDRILMEDFNSDNAKLDAALKSQADALAAESAAREALAPRAGSQLIRTVQATAEGTTVNVHFSGLSWGEWNTVHFTITPEVSAAGAVVSVYVDGDPIGRMSGDSSAHILFCPGQDASAPVWGIFLSVSGSKAFAIDRKFSSFSSFELRTNTDIRIQKGTKIVIRGAK